METPENLDDPDQASFYIPYQGSDNQNVEEDLGYSSSPSIDLPDGYKLRLAIYRNAWAKCLAKIRESIRKLHSPLAANIVQHVKDAYTNVLSGLPYDELPVISVLAQGGGNSILHEVATQLETFSDEDKEDDNDDPVHCAQLVHLYPSDCPNVMTTMKSMISRFIDASVEGRTKRKATTSLANYDIELLKAWYTSPKIQADKPQLVVILHDFEQFEPDVVQDLFYICRLHISILPLVFILSLSSPSEPSYLHTVYPRSTLALLRVKSIVVPAGIEVLEQIIFETFFDLNFDLDVVPGPTVFEFIHEYYTRRNCSLDSVMTILQLIHMKHVDEPLTTFLYDELIGMDDTDSALRMLEHSSSYPFLEYLFTRILASQPNPNSSTHWQTDDLSMLLDVVLECRDGFRSSYRRFKIGFSLIMKVREFMLKSGYKSVESGGVMEMIVKGLRGRLGKDWKYLGIMIKKLSVENLGDLVEQTNWFFEDLPEGMFEQEEVGRLAVASFRDEVLKLREGDEAAVRDIAGRIGEWFTEFLAAHLTKRLDECRLWDIWYTGFSPFPSELINPAPKAHIVAALLHPEGYVARDLRPDSRNGNVAHQNNQETEFSGLPDTSILFRRYLEAGRMINVYDWFESFAVVLESRRRELPSGDDDTGGGEEAPKTPTKKKGKKKEMEPIDEVEAEDEERWGMEVQARFIRAVHELDFIGLIKHTGRKADHVLKTVFDVPD